MPPPVAAGAATPRSAAESRIRYIAHLLGFLLGGIIVMIGAAADGIIGK
jgi:hypothetical protein